MVEAGSAIDVVIVEGINEDQSMRIRVPIDSDISKRVYIEAYVGEEEIASKRIKPENTSSWSFRVYGRGRIIVEIYLDRDLYAIYGVDFNENKCYDITDDPESFETSSGNSGGVHVSGTELSEGVNDKKDESEEPEESEE